VTFTTLHSFDGRDGKNPYAGLIQATDGNLYETTFRGGGVGNIFKITTNGRLAPIYTFSKKNVCNGSQPIAGLVQATDGKLYGTTITEDGGANCYGTVFKITPNGMLKTLHIFDYTDGAAPYAAFVQGINGKFYGTTAQGGLGWGTFFRISTSGTLTTLYNFCQENYCTGGGGPEGALIQATDGNLYGTTTYGGSTNLCNNGCGTVFKITPRGVLTTLHSFIGADGSVPYAGLVQGTDGNFYGTTIAGGASNSCTYAAFPGCGTVFKITPRGTLTTLYNFCKETNCADGANPSAGLIQATDGNFYGTTEEGGATSCKVEGRTTGCGTVFKITPSGMLTTLYNLCSQADCTDGKFPYAELVQATNGDFYGTTLYGGNKSQACDYGFGTVFSLSVGLSPFVKTQPITGTVRVITPSGKLQSNVPFRITP
jgi:uncharacterized repeat protein (TIGR03803 family)